LKEHPCKFIGIAEKQVCRDIAHFESYFQDVIDKGGEGIILRDPHVLLQPGRSAGYLKHKVSFYASPSPTPCSPPPQHALLIHTQYQKYRDAEAKIIGRASSQQWECEL